MYCSGYNLETMNSPPFLLTLFGKPKILLDDFMNLTYLFKKSWRCIVMQHRSCDLVSERACTILLINAFQWFPLKIICVTKCHCASNVTCLWKEVTTWSSQDVSHIRPQKQGKQRILIILKKKIVSSFSRIWYKNDFFFFFFLLNDGFLKHYWF